MKEEQTTPAVFEILQSFIMSSSGDVSTDYNLIAVDRGSISDLTMRDLVHLRDFLNYYICEEGGKCGKVET
ncbi:MAG: hypothetical protein ILA22_01145 [Prevotella sp.]|nr:hypothetical protein [Prevotella sp.]